MLGRSLEDRVIEYRQFGDGARQVLVVGPLEGDETAGLELVESLAEHLQRFPKRTSGARVTLVRDPNPDGRLRRMAGNARGVLLNRNFPTQGWRKLPSGPLWVSGRVPESEPEVRALLDLVDDVQPDCVIAVSATRRSPVVAFAGPADKLVRHLAKASGMQPGAFDLAAEQGSFAVFTGAERKLPTLILHVPAGMRRDVLWTTYKRGLLAAIEGDHAESERGARPNASAAAPVREVVRRNTAPPPPLQALVAASRQAAPAASRAKSAADVPRILSAAELESGGDLVPVVPVRRQFGAASALPPAKRPIVQRPAVNRQPAIRANARGAFPPAVLARPRVSGPAPVPLSSLRPQALAAPPAPRIERLPPVDRTARPAPSQQMPRPIPLYPETGIQ